MIDATIGLHQPKLSVRDQFSTRLKAGLLGSSNVESASKLNTSKKEQDCIITMQPLAEVPSSSLQAVREPTRAKKKQKNI